MVFQKGNAPWNKNKDKSDPRIAKYSAKLSISKLGNIPWNKNKTKETDERIKQSAKKLSISKKGKSSYIRTPETLIKLGNSIRGQKRSPEQINRMKNVKALSVLLGTFPSKKISESRKKFYKEHPEKHLNRICAQKGFISKPQMGMYATIKKYFPEASLEHFVDTGISCRYIDVALPSHMLGFEYDGERFHTNKEQELKRDTKLEGCGWKIIHLTNTNFSELINILKEIQENK